MPAFITTDIGRKYFFGRRYNGDDQLSTPISVPPGNTSKEKYRASTFQLDTSKLDIPDPPNFSSVHITEKYSGFKYGLKGGGYLQFGLHSEYDPSSTRGHFTSWVKWAVFDSDDTIVGSHIMGAARPNDIWAKTIELVKKDSYALLFVYNTQASSEFGGTYSMAYFTATNTSGDWGSELQNKFDRFISGRSNPQGEVWGIAINDLIIKCFGKALYFRANAKDTGGTGSDNQVGGGSSNPTGNGGNTGFGENSKPQGGGSTLDYHTDPISKTPNTPPYAQQAISSGFVTTYVMSASNMRSLASYMWSKSFVDNIPKLLQNPMEALISVNLSPLTPPHGSDIQKVKLGTLTSDANGFLLANQYGTFNLGSINLGEYWANYLDYAPYTEVSIYLPYIGTFDLNVDDVMNSVLSLQYVVDFLSGTCVAHLSVQRGQLNSVLYQWGGNIFTTVPATGADYTGQLTALINGVTATAGSLLTGNAGTVATTAVNAAVSTLTTKMHVLRGSGMTKNAGTLGVAQPYLVVSRPVQSMPFNMWCDKGFPSNIGRPLSELSGYTEIDYIHLQGIQATQDEINEIYGLLNKGVIF